MIFFTKNIASIIQYTKEIEIKNINEIDFEDWIKEDNLPSYISYTFKPNIMDNQKIFKQVFEINDYDFTGLDLINAIPNMEYGQGDDPNGTLTQLKLQIIEQFKEKGINLEWHLDPEGGSQGCGTYMRVKDSSDICMMFFDIT